MASRRVRKRGMEPPYAADQIAACILHPIISTVSGLLRFLFLFFGIIFLLLQSSSLRLARFCRVSRVSTNPGRPLVVPFVRDTSADFLAPTAKGRRSPLTSPLLCF